MSPVKPKVSVVSKARAQVRRYHSPVHSPPSFLVTCCCYCTCRVCVRCQAQALQEAMLDVWTAVRTVMDGARERAEIFLELPDRRQLPFYYKVIKRPVALFPIGM